MQGKPEPDSQFNRLPVHFGQGARMSQGYRAYLGIRLCAKVGWIGTKQFGFCQ